MSNKDETATSKTPKNEDKSKSKSNTGNWSNFKTILGAVLFAFCIRIVFLEPFQIDGPSMEPTLLNGDRVVVSKFIYGLFLPWSDQAMFTWGEPKPGDVVILRSPMDNLDIVKRVVGVPGDTIEVRQGIVYRNGETIRHDNVGPCPEDANETALAQQERARRYATCHLYEEQLGDRVYQVSHNDMPDPFLHMNAMRPTHVPEGHVIVLGDHRDVSNDSRNPAVGLIPIPRIKGKALVVFASWDKSFRSDRFFLGI